MIRNSNASDIPIPKAFLAVAAVVSLVGGAAAPSAGATVRLAVVGDSISAEYAADDDPDTGLFGLLLGSDLGDLDFPLGQTSTTCEGGDHFTQTLIGLLLDAILPEVPMMTDLAARNWVQQLMLNRSPDFDMGAYSNDPSQFGEPRLRGFEYNFARVSATILDDPGFGHDMSDQVAQIIPYLQAGDIDVVIVNLGSNDFAAREIYQRSFCGSDYEAWQDDLVNTLFQAVDDMMAADPSVGVVVAKLPLGTATGQAVGYVLDAIEDTNDRIQTEADARGIATFDPWAFGSDPALADPATGDLYIGGYVVPFDSKTEPDELVDPSTPGSGVLGPCNSAGKCGTLASTLKFISDDGVHPGTVSQGRIANETIEAMNSELGYGIATLTDTEILEAGGTFVPAAPPGPGELTDASKWTQIRQQQSNRCLAVDTYWWGSPTGYLKVKSCKASDSKQRWYVIPFGDGHQLRSQYTASGHANGTCIKDDGYNFKITGCSSSSNQVFRVRGGDTGRNWFIEAKDRHSCVYRYAWYNGGRAYGIDDNCADYQIAWPYMRWGFYLNGNAGFTLQDVEQ